jgi:hypothetical protein
MWKGAVSAVAVVLAIATASAQQAKGLDDILDVYVRDGQVYYRAMKSDRAKLDAFVNRIAGESVDQLSREERMAFWINAYNSLVLRTVVDHYPIQGHTATYPAKSIRQVPGAFDRITHHVAGRTLTLDQIEQTVLPEFQDPRVYLALGRGAEGGGRLRSEAYTAAGLEKQLTEAASECVSRQQCVQVDRQGNKLVVSPIFSWREKEFAASYAAKAPVTYASRSPVERAVLAFLEPRLLTVEKEVLEANTFQMTFGQFDWRLNDLTGRGGR